MGASQQVTQGTGYRAKSIRSLRVLDMNLETAATSECFSIFLYIHATTVEQCFSRALGRLPEMVCCLHGQIPHVQQVLIPFRNSQITQSWWVSFAACHLPMIHGSQVETHQAFARYGNFHGVFLNLTLTHIYITKNIRFF